LISKQGSIDWLCWPRFDSPSIFGAIIDPRIGGHWSIHPVGDSQISRRYVDNTNVLETTFSHSFGKIVLTDFMAVTSEKEKTRRLWPEHELIRLIKSEVGEVRVVVEFDPRPDYGRTTPFIKDTGKLEKTLLTHDTGLRVLYQKLKPLLLPPPDKPTRRRIGLHAEEE
jgi:GH15 family glucan-1,4-alpha-glucosidase